MSEIEKSERGNKFENMTDRELKERISNEYELNNRPTPPKKGEAFDAETQAAKEELERRGA